MRAHFREIHPVESGSQKEILNEALSPHMTQMSDAEIEGIRSYVYANNNLPRYSNQSI
jgi:hypothetical protein